MKPLLYILFLTMFALQSGCGGHAVKRSPDDNAAIGELRGKVDSYLAGSSVEAPESFRLMALIVPEGNGLDAADALAHGFKAPEGQRFDSVVLVGQAQAASFPGASVFAKGVFETPFGDLPVDTEPSRRLINPEAGVIFNPHLRKEEYASPLVLSFLKRALGDCTVIPVLIGQPDRETFDWLVEVLSTMATKKHRRVLLVAMTDLTKAMPYDLAARTDAVTIESIEGLRAGETIQLLRSGEAQLTGGYPVLVIMEAARRAGADTVVALRHTISKNENGTGAGYASLGFYDQPLTDAERVELLTLARRSIEAAIRGEEYEPSWDVSPRLLAPGAAFVTLEIDHRLRGGVGQVQAVGPLYRSVITSAHAAAMDDGRFPPVSAAELDELSYEVSVLTPLVPVLDVRDVELGTHGLYMEQDGHAGMLLPQVPVEQRWDLQEYLRQISLRAGLPPDAWEDEGARLWTFTTEIVR